jgi:hypothetical protein
VNDVGHFLGTFWEPNTNTHRETGHMPTRAPLSTVGSGELVSTAQSTTRNHEGLHAESTEGGSLSNVYNRCLASMPIPTASKWECMDEACRKNVHVSRALCILSTRVFLTRDGFGVGVPNWECLTA